MTITATQKRSIEEVIDNICNVAKGRRKLCEMFMELPDKDAWPEYYKVIPEPRCIEGIKTAVEKGKYKDPGDVYDDIELVFANALHYNETGSQIAKDAITLRDAFREYWNNNANLPPPVSSTESKALPPPRVPQPAIMPAAPISHVSREPSRASNLSPTMNAKIVAPNTTPNTQSHQPADEDGEMSPEPQDNEPETQAWEFAARDEESEEIVRQLERGLPRWEGGHERGWMEDVRGDAVGKYQEIISLLTAYRTADGLRPASSLEEIPEDSQTKHVSFSGPISFKILENRIQTQHYPTARHFDQDMSRLFERARRYYASGAEAYGHTILLQRLYHLLTSPPYPSIIPATASNFSSVSAGPGFAKPLHSQGSESSQAVTTFRIPTKDRVFTDEMTYKGMTIRVGDWVHLMNPDVPAKPIIAQVFKTWIPDGESARKMQQGLTACWYFRPEQTIHPAHRQFWENEVFKTGHFADHVAEDVVEKIACQFTAKHVRGRPRPPYWHPGWPLYVCDSRYNDRERIFVKIKNWNSCIPEDYRKNDFMPIYPFERIIYPKRYPSPFLTGITGPGGIGDSIEKADGEKIEGGGTGRKRTRRANAGQATDHAGPRYGTFVGAPNTTAGSGAGRAAVSSSNQPAPHPQPPPQAQQHKRADDRSIGTAAGGLSNLQGNAVVEVLPADTVKHFDRDPETNQMLWFSGPPIDVARTPAPQNSLKYLHYLALKKRKEAAHDQKQEEDMMEDIHADGEEGISHPGKRLKIGPMMSDTLETLWASVQKT